MASPSPTPETPKPKRYIFVACTIVKQGKSYGRGHHEVVGVYPTSEAARTSLLTAIQAKAKRYMTGPDSNEIGTYKCGPQCELKVWVSG